ncbi:MAG: type II/IV secretion system protein [Candidatus Staskawiczbacteria bacterium]|nr:type II/IV secretion system protein [Candidatus Staskawiczbacteria bacterium]
MDTSNKKILGAVTITPEIIEEVKKDIKNIAGFKKKVEEYLEQNTTNLLDVILFSAIILDASDIHIEPQEDDSKLRIRLDGVLQDVILFEQNIYHSLISRLKLLSKLKLNITDKPQDGRFTIEIADLPPTNFGDKSQKINIDTELSPKLVGGELIEIRTSSLPAEYGESIVMRILNPKNLIGIDELGLRKDLYKIFEKEIQKPNGMIIVTGPTGSGKTTTLYAFLKKIQNPEIKIITIEDPIEYHLKGISQTQVAPDKGYDFSDGLKSIVRQDPDVILVGEIRDLETAKIALQAALTGHLVLSTLHTNDAAGTIPRLIDLGTDASSIAPALKMAVAQRLIRKTCQKCSTLIKPTAKELAEIKKGLKGLPDSIKLPDLNKIEIRKMEEKGCEFCNFSGYKGRQGLFEAFLVDSEMEKFILTNPPVSSIRDLAIKKGMVTMYQSGLIDVVMGNTTLQEVLRVVEEDEEKPEI